MPSKKLLQNYIIPEGWHLSTIHFERFNHSIGIHMARLQMPVSLSSIRSSEANFYKLLPKLLNRNCLLQHYIISKAESLSRNITNRMNGGRTEAPSLLTLFRLRGATRRKIGDQNCSRNSHHLSCGRQPRKQRLSHTAEHLQICSRQNPCCLGLKAQIIL